MDPDASGTEEDRGAELSKAHVGMLVTQMPVLYLIIAVSAVALAATHYPVAPSLLTVVIPIVLVAVCAVRGWRWRRLAHARLTEAEAERLLRRSRKLVVPLGSGFALWAVALYNYGDPYMRCHVAFFAALSTIGCIICLIHLRRAAVMLVIISGLGVIACLLGLRDPVTIAIALNFLLVLVPILSVARRNLRVFEMLVVSRSEIMTRQRAVQKLSDENLRLASIDPLTGLSNRRHFGSELRAAFEALRADGRFGLVLIDLDGFKRINDLYGQAAGDRLLVSFGEALRRAAGPDAIVARLSGDEFAAFRGAAAEEEIAGFHDRIAALLRQPSAYEGIGIGPSVSGGYVGASAGSTSTEEALARADFALHRAKIERRGGLVSFSDSFEAQLRRSALVEQALRAAHLENELACAFQPIVDVAAARIVAVEALARWTSPTLGAVPADFFIPLGERTLLIGRMTEILFAKALRVASGLPADIRLHFNLSALDLTSPETMESIRRMIAAGGVEPGRLEFEITETAVMRDLDQASRALAELQRLGAGVALDDFGTGYSNLRQLHRLRPDTLKIDREFVSNVDRDRVSHDLSGAIIDVCRNLHLNAIAEGVETTSQRRILTELGCRYMQGYLFGQPMPAEKLPGFIASGLGLAAALD